MCAEYELHPYLLLFIHITGELFHIALYPLIFEWISQVASTAALYGGASAFLDSALPLPAHPLGQETGQRSRLPAFRVWADRVPLCRNSWISFPLGQSRAIGTS